MQLARDERSDLMRDKHLAYEQRQFVQAFRAAGGQVEVLEDPAAVRDGLELIRLLAPVELAEGTLVRIGGQHDGGYVMPDPGRGGLAYSIGVSPKSPWDLEMAERDFKVYQYDASIDKEPDEHPNIFFHKYFLSPFEQSGPYKTLARMLADNGHQDERDIILQMDIEGNEWDVLAAWEEADLLRFRQIILELHDVGLSAKQRQIFSKLRRTHSPVHFHYNNNVETVCFIPDLGVILSPLVEITYIRNDGQARPLSSSYFPGALDGKNIRRPYPDIPIGYFPRLLTRGEAFLERAITP